MPTDRAPIAVVFGTRPEAIKLAPVILALRQAELPYRVVTTGQHADMVEHLLDLFDIPTDVTLGLLREGQTLDQLMAAAIERTGAALDEIEPRAVIVQGDTTSMLGAGIAAFHRRIPLAHVEAGLRSPDPFTPFPEEMNRRVASTIARWHFAPTESAAANLSASGITEDVHIVGNTVVDALLHMADHPSGALPGELGAFVGEAPYILATAHRRESWSGGIAAIAGALREVLDAMPDHRLVFVTHPNPIARRPVEEALAGVDRALVLQALPYPQFLRLLRGARLAVSDSGGVQEEGPTLGVPVLATRELTERPDGVAAGAVRVVGTDAARIRDAALELLRSPDALAAMGASGRTLYGDGHAAERIVRVLAGARA